MYNKKFDDFEHELERAIFKSLYYSVAQRSLRMIATGLIIAKHGLRGLLYVWPLTLLLFIDLPGHWNFIKLILLTLAAAAWFRFIYKSVRDDYVRFIQGKLLQVGKLAGVL